jgi:NADPH:quinone reductase-like Zn-dependent oxidoreductase
MQNGLLVEGWPIALGCDASGIVAEVGSEVTKFKVGDGVFGCVRVGFVGYMTFQEYVSSIHPESRCGTIHYFGFTDYRKFLMEESIASKKPDNLSTEQAAAVGVASMVSLTHGKPLCDWDCTY